MVTTIPLRLMKNVKCSSLRLAPTYSYLDCRWEVESSRHFSPQIFPPFRTTISPPFRAQIFPPFRTNTYRLLDLDSDTMVRLWLCSHQDELFTEHQQVTQLQCDTQAVLDFFVSKLRFSIFFSTLYFSFLEV